MITEIVGAENEQKRSLDSPIVPSVCFSAILVSFCGDQCQYNSGYATNLLVLRHFFFSGAWFFFYSLLARFHSFEIFRAKSIFRTKLLTTHRYYLSYFYLLHTTPRGIRSIWRKLRTSLQQTPLWELEATGSNNQIFDYCHLLISLSNQMAAPSHVTNNDPHIYSHIIRFNYQPQKWIFTSCNCCSNVWALLGNKLMTNPHHTHWPP